MKRLMFWIRESTLRAKFRIYERWPALFPHALDIDEQYEELPEDAAEIEFLELHFEEHKAADKIADHVCKNAQSGDLVLTMGAGDIYKVGEMILEN